MKKKVEKQKCVGFKAERIGVSSFRGSRYIIVFFHANCREFFINSSRG